MLQPGLLFEANQYLRRHAFIFTVNALVCEISTSFKKTDLRGSAW